MSVNQIEFKIVKDAGQTQIKLSDMSLHASKAFKKLLDSLIQIIELTPNHEDIKIKILDGSAVAIAEGTDAQILAIEENFEKVSNFESTNDELIKPWREIQSLICANGIEYEMNFIKNNVKTPFIAKLKNPKKFKSKSVRKKYVLNFSFLEGKLMEVGGKKPNFHVTDAENKEITIFCKEEDTEHVVRLLYKQVYVSAWEKKSDEGKNQLFFCDIYVDFVLYNEFKIFFQSIFTFNEIDALSLLHEKLYSYIDGNQFSVLKKFLQLFNNDSVDLNYLKTILVVTKGLKNHPLIKDIRENLREILDEKLKTSLH